MAGRTATELRHEGTPPLDPPPVSSADGDEQKKNLWREASLAAKNHRDINLLAGGQANRGTLEMKGTRNNRRPPWAVPLRDKYPVTSEAERRRVGTLLAAQILRRSTFSCYFSIDQILRIIEWFPRGHRVEACVAVYARCIEFERFVE